MSFTPRVEQKVVLNKLLFKLVRTEITEGRMQAPPVVPAFQVGEKLSASHLLRGKTLIRTFGLEDADAAFHQRVIVGIGCFDHRDGDMMSRQ